MVKWAKTWSKWIKSGATLARIRASEASLAVYATFYFPRKIIKNVCIKVFPTKEDINYILHTCSFDDYVHECSKRTYFHLSLTYIFFLIFDHRFSNRVSHMAKGACYKLNKCSNLVQLWHVIISVMSFYISTVPKIQHTVKSLSRASEARLVVHVSLRKSWDEG